MCALRMIRRRMQIRGRVPLFALLGVRGGRGGVEGGNAGGAARDHPEGRGGRAGGAARPAPGTLDLAHWMWL